MVAQGETKPNIQKTWKRPDGFAKRVFFEKAFDFILSRVASFIRRKCLKQFSTLPPMIKRAFLSTLLLGLAFISSAAKAEKLVINSNESDPAPKETFTKVVDEFKKQNPSS